MEKLAQDSVEAQGLIDQARAAVEAADRAFVRWFNGDVATSAAATRLQRKADELLADVRIRVEDGDLIEWELSGG